MMKKNENNGCLGAELNPATTIVKEWFERNERRGSQKRFLCGVLVSGLIDGHYDEALAIEVLSEKIENMFIVDIYTSREMESVLDSLIEWMFGQIDFDALARCWIDASVKGVQQ